MKNLGVALGAAAKAAPESYKTFSAVKAFNETRKAKKGEDDFVKSLSEDLKMLLKDPETGPQSLDPEAGRRISLFDATKLEY